MTEKQLLASGKGFLDLAFEMQEAVPSTRLQRVLAAYSWANSGEVLDIVIDNMQTLRKAGLLEDAFLDAWSSNKHGTPYWDMGFTKYMFGLLDRKRLRELSDPLPPADPLTVYRGVAGKDEEERRVLGYAWTLDLQLATWFAKYRKASYGLPDPAVYQARIAHEHVLAYLGKRYRNEGEILLLPERLRDVALVPCVPPPGQLSD